MTCIVGVKDKFGVVIGGDSRVSGTNHVIAMATPKVFQWGDMGFGISGQAKHLNALRHRFTPPNHPEGCSVEEYVTTIVVPALRDCLKENDVMGTDTSSFVLGYKGRLFLLNSEGVAYESAEDFCAAGSGRNIAEGCLFTTRNMRGAKARALKALEAAAHFDPWVGPPFNFIRLPYSEGPNG